MEKTLKEEFDEFVKEENEKWAAIMKLLDEHIAIQNNVVKVLDRLTK